MTSPVRLAKISVNSAGMEKVDLGTKTFQVGIWEWEIVAWRKASSGRVCGCLGEIGEL